MPTPRHPWHYPSPSRHGRRMSAVLCGLLLSACWGSAALAQVPAEQMHFARLGADEGLSQGSITAIQQDASGFIWVGTEDGLNRFDGHDFLHVVRDRRNPSSLPNNWISAIARDAAGRLFIGTDGGGVVMRDAATGHFTVPRGANGQPLVDPQASVRALAFDRAGTLWVGTRGGGLTAVDLGEGRARRFRHDADRLDSLSHDSILDLAEDMDGRIWIGSEGGLDSLEPGTDRITRWGEQLAVLLPGGADRQVAALRVDERGTTWFATRAGLGRADPVSRQLTLLRHAANDPYSLPDDRVTALLQDSQRRLWVGTSRGLALLDRRSGRFNVVRHEPGDPTTLPDDHVTTLFEDRGGLLWIGTKSGGLAHWNPRTWSFGHRRLGDGAANNITSFAEDRRGTLWVGSFGGGLVALDRRSGTLRRYGARATSALDIGDDNVMAVIVDAQDRVWAGTMSAGIARIDPRSGRIDRFVHRRDDPASLSAPGIMTLALDSRGNIWVGTFGGGISRIDARDDSVRRLPIDRQGGNGLSSDRATAIAEDQAGLIWIGTDGGGLNVLDPVTGSFRQYLHDATVANSLSANTVYDIHVAADGQVWIGTRGGGLDRAIGAPLSGGGLTFQNYSEIDGLPNSTVYGIESDARERLWLSTNRGLSRFDIKARRFTNFRRSDGLQGDEFNFGAHYAAPSGELFFGGARGYNAFFAERLQSNSHPPPVVITEVLKLNSPVDLGVPQESIRALQLGYKDDVVAFRFAGLDFAAPGENTYQYMLEGFDNDWVDAGTQRQATYTDLDGGRYVFRVRAANSDGVWNEQGASIAVGVEPAPWLTWWAWTLYALAGIGLLASVWFSQQRRVEREAAYKRRLEDEVEERTQELHLRNEQLESANRQLREASYTDPLTGLGNRRALYDAVGKLLGDDRAPGIAGPQFAIMMVDLDRLKPINDQHGHEAGDRVLLQIGEILKRVSRSSDQVVRWGGDEFLLLCQNADMDAAEDLAERIRSAVSKQIFRVGDGVAARTSCSIGFSVYPLVPGFHDRGSFEESLAVADAALYSAKRQRNTWVGWCGSERALDLLSVQEAIERDAAALEDGGYLDVRRPLISGTDTVDELRILQGPIDR
ncbi:MAG: two-component regulator propeller domain-containing protein [Steroidobacteraceae bacterium]